MKTGTVVDLSKELPPRLQEQLEVKFPGKPLSDLAIRYYENVEDVGYEYFTEMLLPTCSNIPAICYLKPFISFVGLGEALILSQAGAVIYDSNHNDRCTETGPFWFVKTTSGNGNEP
jgi:hypothetical protein